MGIWRIPVDEIDRPGSFAWHMNRSIVLLLEVLSQLKDYPTLLKVSSMLQRTPDQGKKYLRDADRQVLAQRAFVLTVLVLEEMLSELTEVSEAPDPGRGSLCSLRMTTDASHPEEGQDVFPKKTLLFDAQGAEALAKGGTQGALPMETPTETPEAHPCPTETLTEPMELEGSSEEARKTGPSQGSCRVPEGVRGPPSGRPATDRGGPESRTAELSLEDLSISSQQQLPTLQPQDAAAAKGRGGVQAPSAEETTSQRPSRKRKLLQDAESGKTLLLDAYRVWQQGQKVMTYDLGKIEKIMSETYMLIKQVDEETALDQAVKFCQVHIGASAQKQVTGETPTTPKHPRDARESCFFSTVAPPASLTPPTGPFDTLASDPLLRLSEAQSKPSLASPTAASLARAPILSPLEPQGALEDISEGPTPILLGQASEGVVLVAAADDKGIQLELCLPQEEPSPCDQPRKGGDGITTTANPALWPLELEEPLTSMSLAGRLCSQAASSCAEVSTASQPMGSQARKAEGGGHCCAVKARVLPSMPKLLIPSSVTKFPPEITVTPPTPTLLSPKGSISEETKQKLKSAILSAQSAANVKKESLCQPALEIVETSSQESSLESDDTEEEEEEEDYGMDV